MSHQDRADGVKTVLLNSGGKDSLATAILLHRDHELHSCFVNTGAPEDAAALTASAMIAEKYCSSHHVIRIGSGPYLATTPSLPAAWRYETVPFKLLVMFALGAMYGVTIGAEAIASGARCDVFYPDFPETLKAALAMSRKVRPSLEVLTPLNLFPGEQSKVNELVVWETIKDDPLWRATSYCNYNPPCGVCYGCLLRKEWVSRG